MSIYIFVSWISLPQEDRINQLWASHRLFRECSDKFYFFRGKGSFCTRLRVRRNNSCEIIKVYLIRDWIVDTKSYLFSRKDRK